MEAAQSSDFAYAEEMTDLQDLLQVALADEEIYWQLKNQVTWHRVGDPNTKFFQASTKQRRARNKIFGILNNVGGVDRE